MKHYLLLAMISVLVNAWVVTPVRRVLHDSLLTGRDGSVDRVPHLLLGGADWPESQEDL